MPPKESWAERQHRKAAGERKKWEEERKLMREQLKARDAARVEVFSKCLDENPHFAKLLQESDLMPTSDAQRLDFVQQVVAGTGTGADGDGQAWEPSRPTAALLARLENRRARAFAGRALDRNKAAQDIKQRRKDLEKARAEFKQRKQDIIEKAGAQREKLLPKEKSAEMPTMDERLSQWGDGRKVRWKDSKKAGTEKNQLKKGLSAAKERLKGLKRDHEKTLQEMAEKPADISKHDTGSEVQEPKQIYDSNMVIRDQTLSVPTKVAVEEERALWLARKNENMERVMRLFMQNIVHDVVEDEVTLAYNELKKVSQESEEFASLALVSAISRRMSTPTPVTEEFLAFNEYEDTILTEEMIAKDRLKEFKEYKEDKAALEDSGTRHTKTGQPNAEVVGTEDAGARNPTSNKALPPKEAEVQPGEWEAKEQTAAPEAEKLPETPGPPVDSDPDATQEEPKEDGVAEGSAQETLEVKSEDPKEAKEAQKKVDAAVRRLAMRSLLRGMQDHREKFGAGSGHSQPLFHKNVETKAMVEQRVAEERRRQEAGEELTASPVIAAEPPAPDLVNKTPPFSVATPGPTLMIGSWCKRQHNLASFNESEYWEKVKIDEDLYLSEDGKTPMVTTPDGAITCIEGTQNGQFLAVGTSGGGITVWDMRKHPPVAIRKTFGSVLDQPVIPSLPEILKEDDQNKATHSSTEAKDEAAGKASLFQVAQAATTVAETATKTDGLEQLEDGPDEEDNSDTHVKGLAFDGAGAQLAAVVGKYALHMWSMAPDSLIGQAGSSEPPGMRRLSSWSHSDLYSSGAGILTGTHKEHTTEYLERQSVFPAICFNPSFTLGGTQPYVAVPRGSGDVIFVRTFLSMNPTYTIWGSGLRQLEPAKHTDIPRADAADDQKSSNSELSKRSERSRGISQHLATSQRAALNTAKAGPGSGHGSTNRGTHTQTDEQESKFIPRRILQELFMPDFPKTNHGTINPIELADFRKRQQDVYRGHNSGVVYVGFIPETAAMITVDASGIIYQWPTEEQERSGFGWFMPTAQFCLPHTLHVLMPEDSDADRDAADFPASSESAQDPTLGEASPSANPPTEEAPEEAGATETETKSTAEDGLTAGETTDNTEDEGASDRGLWLVKYNWTVGTLYEQRVERELGARDAPRASDGSVAALPFTVINTQTGDKTRKTRSKRQFKLVEESYAVVGASMLSHTHDTVDLLIVAMADCFKAQHPDAKAKGSMDKGHAFPHYTAFIVSTKLEDNLSRSRSCPRIDFAALTSSDGVRPTLLPPVFAVQPTVNSMGTDYLYTPIGPTEVGVYSLATGVMVHEFTISKCDSTSGIASIKSLPVSKTLDGSDTRLMAIGIHKSQSVYILKVDEVDAITLTMVNTVPELMNPLKDPQVIEPFRLGDRESESESERSYSSKMRSRSDRSRVSSTSRSRTESTESGSVRSSSNDGSDTGRSSRSRRSRSDRSSRSASSSERSGSSSERSGSKRSGRSSVRSTGQERRHAVLGPLRRRSSRSSADGESLDASRSPERRRSRSQSSGRSSGRSSSRASNSSDDSNDSPPRGGKHPATRRHRSRSSER